MTYSLVSHLTCPKCSETYDVDTIQQLCVCGSPLLVEYKLDEVKKHVTKEMIAGREQSLWRYHELLPVKNEENKVSFEEGMTPILSLPDLGKEMGI